MTLVNFTICVIAALFVWFTNRPIVGLKSVAYGFIAISIGFALAYLLKPVLGRGAIWFGNVAMTGGMFFLLDGALGFRNFRRMPWWLAAGISIPFLIAQTYLLFVRDDRPLRVAILAFLMSSIALAGAAVMSYKVRREDRVTFGIIAFGFTIYAATQILRIVGSLATVPAPDPPLVLLIINVAIIAALFGLSTATNLKLKERIEKLAFLDSLTGLPNRRAFDDRLDRVHTRSIATNSPVALFYIDLDRFKSINDRYGHQMGDIVLKQVATRLASFVHQDDCLARLGGDEFAVLTERYATRLAATPLLDQLCHALSEPIVVIGISFDLSVSCGMAFYPDDVSHPHDLLREADIEMYQMKRRVSVRP